MVKTRGILGCHINIWPSNPMTDPYVWYIYICIYIYVYIYIYANKTGVFVDGKWQTIYIYIPYGSGSVMGMDRRWSKVTKSSPVIDGKDWIPTNSMVMTTFPSMTGDSGWLYIFSGGWLCFFPGFSRFEAVQVDLKGAKRETAGVQRVDQFPFLRLGKKTPTRLPYSVSPRHKVSHQQSFRGYIFCGVENISARVINKIAALMVHIQPSSPNPKSAWMMIRSKSHYLYSPGLMLHPTL